MNLSHRKDMVSRLIEWGKNTRDNFPWRKPKSVYESAIAEVMLIRTPAEQVLPVYNKFITEIPTINILYNTKPEQIKKYINCLGLLWRVNILKDMSIYVIEQLSGEFPEDINGLKKIPGIGDYSAAAITTYFFKKRAVLIDSNTVRFLKRFYNITFNGEARRSKKLYNYINQITPEADNESVKFNEAFLDFMRKVCKPRNPECRICAIRIYCKHSKNMV